MTRLITPILLIAVAVGLYFVYINPARVRITELRSQVAEFEMVLEQTRSMLSVRDSLLSKFNAFARDDLDRLETLLPDAADSVALVLDIDTVASAYGISLDTVDVSLSDVGDEQIGRGSSPVQSARLSFSVQAPYESFAPFLEDLEKSLKLLDVTSVRFEVGETGQSVYQVELETYYLDN